MIMNTKLQLLIVEEFKHFFALKDEECILILKRDIKPNLSQIINWLYI